MFRGLVALVFLSSTFSVAAVVQVFAPLPPGAVVKALQLDAGGNIYVAGSLPRNGNADAFAAKLSPDASTALYFTVLSGSGDDSAAALALSSDGSAYIAGATQSTDFSITSGAPNPSQGFLARLDPSGNVVYAAYIGGAATGMALDNAGNLLVTGHGISGFPATSGAPASGPGGFLLKLDATLSSVLLSVNGYGGGLVSVDAEGNIYLAGAAAAGTFDTLPALSSGAFQSTHASRFCFQSPGPSGFALDCSYQYVAKFDPTGINLLWATYVTGTYGATAEGMAVDTSGNVILAGTTNSPDYPVTPGAFQAAYTPAAPLPPGLAVFPMINAPFPTGYVTKLNADGTGLLWSTYFGGTYADHITGMAISATGDIYISGSAGSSDLPILSATPLPCRPQANQVLGFVARLSSDGATAGATQLVYGIPACLYSKCTSTVAGPDFTGWPLALRTDGTAAIGGVNGRVAAVDFSRSSRLGCVGDSGDRAQLAAVAPGQLISIFGAELAFASQYKQAASVIPSTEDFGVFFNDIPAPIIYSSTGQINIQVPYEIAGQDSVQMRVVDNKIIPPLSETRRLDVVDRRPNVFLADPVVESPIPGFSPCAGTVTLGIAPIAVNADGTVNDCTHPAAAGSTVTIFVNGLGAVTPAQTTGAIETASVPISPGVDVRIAGDVALESVTSTAPGSITGVAEVEVQLPSSVGAVQSFMLSVGGVPLPEAPVIIWTRERRPYGRRPKTIVCRTTPTD